MFVSLQLVHEMYMGPHHIRPNVYFKHSLISINNH